MGAGISKDDKKIMIGIGMGGIIGPYALFLTTNVENIFTGGLFYLFFAYIIIVGLISIIGSSVECNQCLSECNNQRIMRIVIPLLTIMAIIFIYFMKNTQIENARISYSLLSLFLIGLIGVYSFYITDSLDIICMCGNNKNIQICNELESCNCITD